MVHAFNDDGDMPLILAQQRHRRTKHKRADHMHHAPYAYAYNISHKNSNNFPTSSPPKGLLYIITRYQLCRAMFITNPNWLLAGCPNRVSGTATRCKMERENGVSTTKPIARSKNSRSTREKGWGEGVGGVA